MPFDRLAEREDRAPPVIERPEGRQGRRRLWPRRTISFQACVTAGVGVGGVSSGVTERGANFSLQRIFPVACITTNNVVIEPIVIANPVKPFRKKAYEKAPR